MEAEIIINGNVGADVAWRDHGEYGGRATFSLACTPAVQRDGLWVDLPTAWYRVVCWRRLAANVRDSVAKGDAVIVGGRLRLERWSDEAGHSREGYTVEAAWVAHDLRRGASTFRRSAVRSSVPAQDVAPDDLNRVDGSNRVGSVDGDAPRNGGEAPITVAIAAATPAADGERGLGEREPIPA